MPDEDKNYDNVQPYTRRDVLNSEYNKAFKELVKLDVEIKVLERTDPKAVVAREPATFAPDGKTVLSFTEISAEMLLKKYRTENKGFKMRVDCIEILLKELK